jgi:hypothetical protein
VVVVEVAGAALQLASGTWEVCQLFPFSLSEKGDRRGNASSAGDSAALLPSVGLGVVGGGRGVGIVGRICVQ